MQVDGRKGAAKRPTTGAQGNGRAEMLENTICKRQAERVQRNGRQLGLKDMDAQKCWKTQYVSDRRNRQLTGQSVAYSILSAAKGQLAAHWRLIRAVGAGAAVMKYVNVSMVLNQ